ncbi:MAG: flagellar basal body P-ring formation chaperone FlgA [Candidatus Latescibacterota bacterium]|nr:flagellar basal body P-ring formation chaperone FlgA [Candidatus Latescibacterota bacterium]
MIRRIIIVVCIAVLAFAIASIASAETAPEPAPMAAIPEDLMRSIISTWTREQIEAAQSEDFDGSTRYEVSARWQGDILLKTAGQVEFEIKRLSSRPFRGPTVVRLELYVDGNLDRSLAVTVDCRYYRDVVVTTRAVRRGSPLESDAFVIEERDITSLKHGWFDALEDLADAQAGRPIGIGEIVSHRHVEPIPVVHRGDDIIMAVMTDNMSLLAAGEALQDGGVGERIRVRNLDSKKVIYGRVVDASTIRISSR